MLQSLAAVSWCTWYEYREWICSQNSKHQHMVKQGIGISKAWKLQILPVLLSMLANQGLILCMSSNEIPDFPELERACIHTMWHMTVEEEDCNSFTAICQTMLYLDTKLEASTHLLKAVYFKRAEAQLVQTVDLNVEENWLT
jgi:hypothetical protein